MPVNAKIPAPRPPGPWVNADSCECGAVYEWDSEKVRWADGVERMRLANGEDEHGNGGGFRSRSGILWAMHVVKLEAWYSAHSACDERPQIPLPTEVQPCRTSTSGVTSAGVTHNGPDFGAANVNDAWDAVMSSHAGT